MTGTEPLSRNHANLSRARWMRRITIRVREAGRASYATLRAERRVDARSSRAPDVAGCVAIPSYSPADSESAGFLCIAAYVENSLFCRIGRAPDQAGQASGSRAVRSQHRRACRPTAAFSQPHRTGSAVGIGLRRWDDITLGDGKGKGERAHSRRYVGSLGPAGARHGRAGQADLRAGTAGRQALRHRGQLAPGGISWLAGGGRGRRPAGLPVRRRAPTRWAARLPGPWRAGRA